MITRPRDTDETGAMLLLLLLMITVLLYLSLLIIDLSQIERLMRTLQRSVDAASLAGATELNLTSSSDLIRWTNAKRLAIASLRRNLVLRELDFPDISSVSTHHGLLDPCDTAPTYQPVTYDNGDYRITLERGRYSDDGSGFIPMEDPSKCRAAEVPVANAMQVTVTAYGSPLMFGALMGMNESSSLTATAIGTHVD